MRANPIQAEADCYGVCELGMPACFQLEWHFFYMSLQLPLLSMLVVIMHSMRSSPAAYLAYAQD